MFNINNIWNKFWILRIQMVDAAEELKKEEMKKELKK